MRDAGWGARRVGDLPSPKSYGEASRRSGGPARQVGGAGAFWRNWALSVHGFKLFFDTRGNFATGFEKCMLPGNINDRIVTFANKDEGFD
jgi:hypothetical protein